jgi:hypothetical protein
VMTTNHSRKLSGKPVLFVMKSTDEDISQKPAANTIKARPSNPMPSL